MRSKKDDRKKTTGKRLWVYIGKSKKLLLTAFLFSVIGNTMGVFTPLLMGKAIDKIAGAGKVDFPALRTLLLLMLLLYLVSSLFQWFMSVLSNKASNNTVRELRGDAFCKLNKLPVSYFDRHPHGDIISRLTNDIDSISDGIFQGITQIMSSVVIITGSFVFMMIISPLITLGVILVTPLCFFLASFIAKHSRRMFRMQSSLTGELNGYAEEIIENQKLVMAFGYEEKVAAHFKEQNEKLYRAGQKAQWYSSLTNPTTRLVNNIAYVLVTVAGGILSLAGRLSVGNIASFLTYSNQFAKPINEITAVASQIQAAFASAERVFALLDEEEELDRAEPFEELAECQGNVEFCNVYFSYKKELPLIENFNLKVKKGSTIAIVGPTGSGKTTLVNLLMRFYELDGGHILIDDKDILHVRKDELRKSIGMVLQESWLISGTVAENIAYGRKEVSREEIVNAAKAVKAHGFIMRLRDGYDTIIEEDGRNLSQGQKQLLTIARVLIMDPPMLILDEATSSIDTRTEIKIQEAFLKMMKGRTSFVIAHRLSTIKEADTILVLKNGNIVEQGDHKELLRKKGFYYTLYHSQFSS
ncbi:ABC transporter ATP-binding protein [Anaerocolumna xylanovorans]|uniref:ATP-binding cassette, subfamily B n=1 Tax=Anaerocolumna xylanovorans DSM 12503 TaxID=1121345 RepID=A0A1M7YF26_9FIRM|nr:ABC transporter ATP-binding protein [Anaerocolumna xylanovorans]SHO51237.1 ATP-binding cassette, subfamily B [Anaerocolumna xylanovorans DSM 12503]